MSVFNTALNNLQVQENTSPVMLVFNETARELPADLARGRTVQDVVRENASYLGVDVSRIANYAVNGEIQPGNTTVRAGDQIRVAVDCESKG